MDEYFEKWVEAYREGAATGNELMWPSETLVRLFKSDYIPGLNKNYSGKKVIEVGFGNGNNLIFLSTLGLKCYGIEVKKEICNMVNIKLQKYGISAELNVGVNKNIPYPDNHFDYLVSWNVIHYEDNEDDIKKAILEYHRVLKSDGRFFISTTGPEHKILNDGETVGSHRYKIGRKDDFRKGQVYFYFDAPNYIHYYFDPHFKEVYVGRTHDFLFTETLDWFIITGIKS